MILFRYSRIVLLAIGLSSRLAFAATYYVSPTGTEPWPGCTAKEKPCLASNSSKAFLTAQAGDTVYFLDGIYSGLTYSEASYKSPAWNPANSGTSGSPIVFKALNNKGAHLIGLQTESRQRVPLIGANGPDYIVWDGFILSAVDALGNPQMAAVYFYYSDHSIVRNCEIRGATHGTGGAINYEGIRVEGSTGVTVENCLIHGFRETSNNHNTSGFKSYATTNVTIRNCEFSDNSVGIYLKGSGNNGTRVINNWIHGNFLGFLYSIKSASTHALTFANNVVTHSSFSNVEVDSNFDALSLANDTLVYNNTFVGSGWQWAGADLGKGPTLYNNIFYGSGTAMTLRSIRDGAARPLASDHNRMDISARIRLRDYGAVPVSYSSFSDWKASSELEGNRSPEEGSITSDPQFRNSSGELKQLSDFALSESSPARGVGRNGLDLGANVSTVGIQWPGAGVLPSRPSNLSVK